MCAKVSSECRLHSKYDHSIVNIFNNIKRVQLVVLVNIKLILCIESLSAICLSLFRLCFFSSPPYLLIKVKNETVGLTYKLYWLNKYSLTFVNISLNLGVSAT